jgi:hypothetical protein
MKHIIDGMEFIFKAFIMCFRCTFKAFGVVLWHFGGSYQGVKNCLVILRARWGANAMAPLKSAGLCIIGAITPVHHIPFSVSRTRRVMYH